MSKSNGQLADSVMFDVFPTTEEGIMTRKPALVVGDVVLFTTNDNVLLKGIIWSMKDTVRHYTIRTGPVFSELHKHPREKITPLDVNIFDCGVLQKDAQDLVNTGL